jgi:hypothetical protein
MCNSLKRVGLLALTLTALALPSVGIAGVQAASMAEMGWQDRSAAKLIALHFKHEDALYAGTQKMDEVVWQATTRRG